MATTTIAALKKKHNRRGNVRKGLNAVAFLAPPSVDLPEALTDAGGQLRELPAGWLPIGLLGKDGLTFSADVSIEEVEALGYVESVRTDLVKAPKTVKLTALEAYRKHLQQLVYGVDLSQVKANKDTGEIVFDEAPLPLLEEFRLLTIMSDGPADDEWLVGRGFPRVKLNTIPEEAWKGDDAVQFELEFAVFSDEVLGTPCRHFVGGTGAIKHLDSIGFEKAA
jgi:major tail protein|nr:MAG TPA: major tail protein [Caudoviricetes sp.]